MTTFEQTPETQAAIVEALHPIYAALVREFVIEVPDYPAQGSTDKAINWLLRVDAEMQVHQLRQFLQTTPLASEPVLRCLLLHHLQKTVKSSADRDKIDFLLVQYFSFCAPTAVGAMGESDADFEFVAQVLEPVLGEQHAVECKWSEPLERCIQAASRCTCLSDLLHCGSIEQGRKIKSAASDDFYEPAAMVTFARFSYAIRRVFFRLMQHDLNTILDGLCELERPWHYQRRLPVRAVFRGRTDQPPAHDLPVLESNVPRRVFLGPAAAHAGRSESGGGERPGWKLPASGRGTSADCACGSRLQRVELGKRRLVRIGTWHKLARSF